MHDYLEIATQDSEANYHKLLEIHRNFLMRELIHLQNVAPTTTIHVPHIPLSSESEENSPEEVYTPLPTVEEEERPPRRCCVIL